MTSQIKQKIAKNLFDSLQSKLATGSFNELLGSFSLRRSETNQVIWKVPLPLSSLVAPSLDMNVLLGTRKELVDSEIVKQLNFSNILDNYCVLHVEIDLKHFIKDVLDSDPTKLSYQTSPKKVIVEFSSPNIAKPFHMGHLRSTIIGNCVANIKKKFGDDVIKMNYLGDWGTQIGMIKLGMKLENYSEEDVKKDPLKVLFAAYVTGNAEAEKHQELYEEAKKIFYDLESEKEEITELWTKYRNWTLEELKNVYNRLNISFDEYTWESDCRRKKADIILKKLEEKRILSVDHKGRKVAVLGDKNIPLLKSDDTTLYLVRDLVALMDRRTKHSFDEMYYVVENGQSEHFHLLLELSSELKIDEGVKLEHVKFGRLHRMSTRKGKVTLLTDILNEAQERVYKKQMESKNTKTTLQSKDVADILGVSMIIVNDLKQSRMKDYEFSWENNLRLNGDTGVCLQYCHCRLCNLEIESGHKAASECDPEALLEPKAVHLVMTMARYEESLWNFRKKLEPCALVKYMFDLVKAVNGAYKCLNVKNADSHVASQRLLLFKRSREILNEGLRLIGVKPISKM